MKAKSVRIFNPKLFLTTIGEGRKILPFEKGQTIFAQGGPTDAVFYVQKGKIKLTVVSQAGKEATVGLLGEGSFFGEGGLAGAPLLLDHHVREVEARHDERSGLDEPFDAFLVHHVAVIDNVEAGIEGGEDAAFGDDMAANLAAALMRGLRRRVELRLRHRHHIGGP